MSRKTLVTVGFLSMLAASLVLSGFDSFAADAQKKKGKKETAASESKKKPAGEERTDVIETAPKEAQHDSMTPGKEGDRKDMVEGVGSKGDVFPSTGGPRKDVQEKINE